jgi:hypothetical protein
MRPHQSAQLLNKHHATITDKRQASRGVNDPIDSGAGPPRADGTGVVSHHGLLSIADAVAF